MVLNKIEDKMHRVHGFFNRLYQAEEEEIPSVLEQLWRDKMISQKEYDALWEDGAIELPSIAKIINGAEVFFLPGDIKGLFEKFKLLSAEFLAGNTTTRNELVSILDELCRWEQMTEEEYTT